MVAQVCRSHPGEKGKYIKIILALLQSTSTAVVYECAVTLVSLSQAPTAIRAAANCYCQLLVSQSDNNVKLIVLERCVSGARDCLRLPHRFGSLRRCWQRRPSCMLCDVLHESRTASEGHDLSAGSFH